MISNDILNDDFGRALLVGVNTNEDTNFELTMRELEGLAKALQFSVVGTVTQNAVAINSATYVGSGKINDIRSQADTLDATHILLCNSLSPSQQKNLQDCFDQPVWDFTMLILEIFKERARTNEAKLQVELASLQYMLPRLIGMNAMLSRQGGSKGSSGAGSVSNRGAGETQLELDRRKIEKRISVLKHSLTQVKQVRSTMRSRREDENIPVVSLVGYTNAGKSTLMNSFIELSDTTLQKNVYVENMLFATLDTQVRKIRFKNNEPFLLTDTVGFIRNLPHTLIHAFSSTLEEIKTADLLLMVIDSSDPEYRNQMDVTHATLKEIGADQIPVIYVFNKAEVDHSLESLPLVKENCIYLSAKQRIGFENLLDMINDALRRNNIRQKLIIPYTDSSIHSMLVENTKVYQCEYLDDGIHMEVLLNPKLQNQMAKFYAID